MASGDGRWTWARAASLRLWLQHETVDGAPCSYCYDAVTLPIVAMRVVVAATPLCLPSCL